MFSNPPVPLTSLMPMAESTAADVGNGSAAARDNHVHPRLTSTTVQTLGTGGDVNIVFTRSFDAMPGIACTAYKATDNLPVTFEVKSWLQDAQGKYIGCTIHGGKAQTLPNISGVTLVTGLIAALNQFNPFSGDATGTQFSCIAVQVSK